MLKNIKIVVPLHLDMNVRPSDAVLITKIPYIYYSANENLELVVELPRRYEGTLLISPL